MTELLDTIDSALQEVEEQLLQEFNRIRNTLSDARFEPVDPGVKASLVDVLNDLKHKLEHSGDKTNLQLLTERHENLFARLTVVRQLLDAKVPTAYLHEVHDDVKTRRRKLEAKVVAKRQNIKIDEPTEKKSGFLGSLKGMFGAKKSESELARNRIRVTEQEEKELQNVEVYLDNGIYSASRELAMLANRVNEAFERDEPAPEPKQKPRPAPPTGKALFESRDLSSKIPDVKPKPRTEPKTIAQTPEEIRRKLEASQPRATGESRFEAKDLSQTIAPTPKAARPKLMSPTAPAAKRDIAQTPEDIRKKLAARQSQSSGKASFAAKDIPHVEPREQPKKKPEAPADEPPKTGKAVFEARDLSKPDPGRKP